MKEVVNIEAIVLIQWLNILTVRFVFILNLNIVYKKYPWPFDIVNQINTTRVSRLMSPEAVDVLRVFPQTCTQVACFNTKSSP